MKTRHATYAFSQCNHRRCHLFPSCHRFRSMKYCTLPYPDELRLSMGLGNSLKHINQMQDKSHTQARTRHTQASRCRARAQAQWARHAQAGAGHAHIQALCRPTHYQWQGTGTCSQRPCPGSTRAIVPGVSLPLSLVCSNRAGYQRNTTLENGEKQP